MNILLVDDDREDTELFIQAVTAIDPNAVQRFAYDGKEALQILTRGFLPDMIFLDINMPFMNGWEVLAELKANPVFRTIPVLMQSTTRAQTDITKAFQLGAMAFITKPPSFRENKAILEIVMGGLPPQELQEKCAGHPLLHFPDI